MTQACTHGRWTSKDTFLSPNHACMRRETRELVNSFPLESAFLGGLKTCMATLLLIAKDSDMMVAHYTADLEGPEGKTRYDDWGFLVQPGAESAIARGACSWKMPINNRNMAAKKQG